MALVNQAETLRSNLDRLSASDRRFAESLLAARERYGLSQKQDVYFQKLVARATQPTETAVASKKVEVGSFDGVIGLFDRAKQHIKFPKIRLQLEDGSPIVLSVAGPNSRAPGTVNVTDGGSYGQNTWYGRVIPSGEWQPSRDVDGHLMGDLGELLQALSKNPAETAAHYGKLTGRCCFCHIKLSDDRSTAVGYGETCADHYGLPWGEKRHSFVSTQEEMRV